MPRSRLRLVPSLLLGLVLTAPAAVALAPAAHAADTDVKLNEINHVGTDFVELVNTGSAPVDISGFKLLDGDSTHAKFPIPSGTTLNPGARLTFENFGWGLGDADSVFLYAADGTTVLDSFTWAAPGAATTSWARCPDSTGAFAISAAVSKGTPNVCSAASVVKINEIESQDGTPGDWVELKNTSGTAVDASGLVVKDNDDTHAYTVPASTSIAAGGYLVLEQAQLGFGLGDADSVRLFATDGTTVLDSYTWTFPAATTTYGRCPDGTGTITKTQAPTKGAANTCLTPAAWPGGSAVSTVDAAGAFGENMSGLAYEAGAAGAPGTLWAVKNNPGTLYRVVKTGSTWGPDGGDWAAGKVLHFGNGLGNVDAEGVTITDAGPSGGVYVAVERDNGNGSVSRPSILRFAPGTSGAQLTATNDYDLTTDLPGLGANLGPEAIAWVPDSYLVAKGFTTAGGTAYDPAAYPGHGTGLFFIGIENTGNVYAYALSTTGSTATRVATFDSGFQAVMELHFEQETQKLWVVCDDTCQGRSARFDVATSGPAQGTFTPVSYYERPAGMPNLNNEGFTTTPRSECVGGSKPVFWSDDSATGDHALRAGTVSCTRTDPSIKATVTGDRAASGWYRGPVTVTFACTAGTAPLAGACPAPVVLSGSGADQSVTRTVTDTDGGVGTVTVADLDVDRVAPTVAVGGVKAGQTYRKNQKPTCVGSDALSGLAGCAVSQKKQGKRKYVVTATATDAAGNVTSATLTYKVKAKKKR